jgi:hypothetical protein
VSDVDAAWEAVGDGLASDPEYREITAALAGTAYRDRAPSHLSNRAPSGAASARYADLSDEGASGRTDGQTDRPTARHAPGGIGGGAQPQPDEGLFLTDPGVLWRLRGPASSHAVRLFGMQSSTFGPYLKAIIFGSWFRNRRANAAGALAAGGGGACMDGRLRLSFAGSLRPLPPWFSSLAQWLMCIHGWNKDPMCAGAN